MDRYSLSIAIAFIWATWTALCYITWQYGRLRVHRLSHYLIAYTTLIIMLVEVTTTVPAFITTPTSINATLGSTATFNCSATTGAVGWLVNDSLLTELNTPDITISSIGRTFFLHVPAREEYNNTFVRCVVVIRGGNTLYSDPVILKIQGLLDAVTNLRSESLGQVIRLTWDAPFSLDITGVDPDIWYHVVITVGNNLFKISSINVIEFNFTMDGYNNTNASVIYKFWVTPINGAGNGTTSTPVAGYFSGSLKSITHDIIVTSSSATVQSIIDMQPTTSPVPSVTPSTTYDTPFSSVVVAITVAVCTVLVAAFAVIVVVTLRVKTTVKKYKLKKREIEMKPNQAYETVNKPQSTTRVHTEPCPAYGYIAHSHH